MKLIKHLIFLLFVSQIFSQQSITEKAEALINSDYFHTYKIEKFFLHTNKSVYFAGEKIWFKAYIVEDDNNTPFIETINVYVNLYDENFELVASHLFYAENGKTHGEIELSKDLKSSNYYLQIDTQWNKNFNRDAIFPIQIIDLANTNNISVNNEIPVKPLDYSPLKESKDGFKINRIESINNKSITFKLATHSEFIAAKALDKTIAFAVLHREGSLRSIAPIKFKKEIENYKINFAKDDLFNGINTITLFDKSNEPIAQSNFFYNANPTSDIKIEKRAITEDSLTISINTHGIYKKANLSISVLPESSIMYKNNANILSHFLIQPYIKQNDISIAQRIIRAENLDELAKLKAKENTFAYKYLTGKPLSYANEAGLNLNGKVQTKEKDLTDYQLMLSSNENNITEFATIDSENKFKFEKLLLLHPSNYSLSLRNKKGKTEKASFFIYNTYTNYKANTKLNITNEFKTLIHQTDSLNNLNTNNDFANATFPEYGDAETLDEVNLEVYKRKKEFELKQKLKNSGILGITNSRVIKPEDTGYNDNLFLTFLQTLPSTTVVYTQDGTPQLVNNRGPRSINDAITPPLSIVWDGAILQDLSVLAFVYASEIDYVVLNINGAGYGSNFPYGVLHVVSKKGKRGASRTLKNKDIQENKTVFGFNASKEKYELPELNFTSQKSIDNFSTIDWVPNVKVNPNTDNLIKINRRYHDNIKLIINGITEDGIPIYKEQIITLSEN